MIPGGMSRRYLLLLAVVAVSGFFFPRCRAIFRQLVFSPSGGMVPPRPLPDNRFVRDNRSLISVVRASTIRGAVAQAVELIGGIERLELKGKEVLVKPNVVSSSPPPTTTHPEVVRSVVEMLYAAGAKRVKVGDSSAIITLPTRRNMEKTGIKKAAEQAGAEVLYLEEMDWVEVAPPQARYARKFFVSKPVYEAERIVSLPVIKTHRAATYSISLKNFIGIIHPRNRPSIFRPKEWEEIIAEMNLAVHPDLVIADGTTSMVAGGPWRGSEAETNLIMASGDRVAIDLAGLALIKSFLKWEGVSAIPVWEQRQIKRAVELGLGASSPAEIDILSASRAGEEGDFSKLVEDIKRFVG